MLDIHVAVFREEDLRIVKRAGLAQDNPHLCVGDRARRISGGPEMIILDRYDGGDNGQRAVSRWLDSNGDVKEFDFFCGNLRRVQIN